MSQFNTRADLHGMKYGRLTVLRYSHTQKKHAHWLCACECGVVKAFAGNSLVQGLSQSCGCLKRDRAAARGRIVSVVLEKPCNDCGLVTPASEFGKHTKTKDRLGLYCKQCQRERGRQWRQKAGPSYWKAHRAKNPEKHKAYAAKSRLEHPEAHRGYTQKYRANNPEKAKAFLADCSNRRRAAQLGALPSWANLDKVRAVYDEAQRLEKETGTKYHVDHIVPLQSPLVCGLHVEHNLQLLPAQENLKKWNRWWPDMP